ncbi:hypothetical protein PG993_012919 [Apiospora rasikravindrae]|uniref:Uncharacterized protein n=1 Tax=Apiospora rasikravindrae TaxID=990691 RepID=A0ABR1RW64_9PEZI
MTFLIVLSLMLSLVACLPNSLSNLGAGRKTFHDLAQFSWKNWTLTEVCLDCTRTSPSELFDCEYKFRWDDPNFNTSAHCNNPWKWDGITTQQGPNNTYNTNYIICEMAWPEVWQLRINNIQDELFELGLIHTCKDEMLQRLPAPPEIAEFFAVPNFTMQLMGRDDYSIVYAAKEPVSVLIQGLTSSPA